jgi:nuclear pore complex protein Nup205
MVFLQEIKQICACATERNAYRAAVTARRQAFDAWRQVIEVLLTACPADLLQGELRQNVIFELLQDLLDKVSNFLFKIMYNAVIVSCF